MLTWSKERLVEHIETLTRGNEDKAAELIKLQEELNHVRAQVAALTHDEVPGVSVTRSNEAMTAYRQLRAWAKNGGSDPGQG